MKENVKNVDEKLEEKQENMRIDSVNSQKNKNKTKTKQKKRVCKHVIC